MPPANSGSAGNARRLAQQAGADLPALEILLQQIIAGQARGEKRMDDLAKDVSAIKESLRDGSGQFRAVTEWQKRHDGEHQTEKSEQAAKLKESKEVHWLLKGAGNAAAGAFGAALMWWVLAGVVASAPAAVAASAAASGRKP